jgi:ADP-ribose pyrophosphatase
MERIVYRGHLIELVHKEIDQSGKTKVFEYARRPPGVRIIVPSGNRLLISKEFRHELQAYDYRLPGGKVFDSLDEATSDILMAAKLAVIREAKEEMGITVKSVQFFHKSICGATMEWDLYYFVVEDFERGEQQLEEGEDIQIESVDFETVKAMCLDGRISEERSALVLLRYLHTRNI